MKQELNILMVDDHPMILKGYIETLKGVQGVYVKCIDTALTTDGALKKIHYSKSDPFNIVFLDINMPPSKCERFLNGEDLGIFLRKAFPSIKILILTMLNDNYRISSLLKSVNPNGFILKSKLTSQKLEEALKTIIMGDVYYCEIVGNLVRKRITSTIDIDDFDRKILHYLAQGEKTKNLPNIIPLSMPTIERRKRKLKHLFDAAGNKSLLDKAKEKGFI